MTEDEAKAKWCPFARVGGPMNSEAQGTSYNRWPSSDGTTTAMLKESGHIACLGSACMAWRKTKAPAELNTAMVEWRDGYCGLAGKP